MYMGAGTPARVGLATQGSRGCRAVMSSRATENLPMVSTDALVATRLVSQ
jgi:hypothetical protein